METNEILDKLPLHLRELIIDQPYKEYTAQDHAIWRYVMRQNLEYLPQIAHHSYLDGITKTGISIHEIPHMYGMNRILKEIGWAAAAVDGFIPPSAFMEFQAYHVLVIAADIRPINQIGYTPAPDIIHEAAGHAPIIADNDYSEYLIRFGEIGSKAFRSEKDHRLYNAIRHLSILKADPYTPKENIDEAQRELEKIESLPDITSELSQIRNLHWWTVEYGLIGELNKPKIYGAGLLSSISESYSCLKDRVKKIPYTLDAANTPFDITNQQPQLFVTPSFNHLTNILEDFASTMAFKTGGLTGVNKAVNSKSVATCELNTGLQVSGVFTRLIDHEGQPVYLQTNGPSSLNFDNKQIRNHGKNYHSKGYGTAIGKMINFPSYARIDEASLEKLKDQHGKVKIEFVSGIKITGIPFHYYYHNGRLLIISFDKCVVKYRNEVLFEPSFGIYDWAIGESVISCYPGPADPKAFDWHYPKIKEKTHKIQHSEKGKKLHSHYKAIKEIREEISERKDIDALWNEIKKNYPDEWLIQLEILEILEKTKNKELYSDISDHLNHLMKRDELRKLIKDGLKLTDHKVFPV